MIAVAVSFLPATAGAQHEHPSPPGPGGATQAPADAQMQAMPGMDHMHMQGPLGISAAREGSGTAWQPDSTPMWAVHGEVAGWGFMFHENAFIGLDSQSGARGDTQIFSTNWLMGMARHELGPGQIVARLMLSLEPLTVRGGGYPLLLETGETWQDVPLHDHQHPHDLFSEVALQYWTGVANGVGVLFYAAAAGEPALGPVAFPHRTSGRSDPLGVIGHHWQDSTHVSYGVLTAGVFGYRWKLDGSWFNSREPDENRYDFDFRAPDAYSGRITINPDDDWSVQASYGYLKSPEEARPDESVHRITGSATFNRAVYEDGNWATTAVMGINVPSDRSATSAWLLETNLDLTRHHTIFQRFEIVTKTGEDFVLDPSMFERRYTVAALAAGYVFSFDPLAGFVPAIGVRGSLNVIGAELEPYYASRTPIGGAIYVQVRPADMRMMSMSAGEGHRRGYGQGSLRAAD